MKYESIKDGGVVRMTFGKVAYTNPKRKTNLVDVEFGLRMLKGNQEPYMTMTCGVWNSRQTDYVTCGACLDEVKKFIHTPLFKEMCELDDKYHLCNESNIPEEDLKRIKSIINEGVKALT